MARGHPDWQAAAEFTAPTISSWAQGIAGVGPFSSDTITPGAGNRVRLLGYRLNISLGLVTVATAGRAFITTQIEGSASGIKDRMAIELRALANSVAYDNVDSGWITVPGGGMVFADAEIVRLVSGGQLPAGATLLGAVYFNRAFVIEAT